MSFTIGSLFDGSGGFPLAASLCGGIPVWASEVEPYPIAVTRSRFPNMKHLGDISKINGAEIEPVDVVSSGSPCQDLSVAGKRAGLKHTENGDEETTRSGLFMEAVRIIKEMRGATNGAYPRFVIWENVPGAFSSNKGEDFRIVLEEFIKIAEPSAVMPSVPAKGWAYADSYRGDGWSLAYRVLDAQYWGVPQRRRRIYLVADFGGERAEEILFERESLRGYLAQSGTPRKAVAADAERSVGAADCEECVIAVTTQQGGAEITDNGICPTVTAAAGMSGNNQPWICKPCGIDGYNGDLTGGKAATLGVNCGLSTGRNGVVVPYPLKIRSGVAVDSAGKAAGKGALIQVDKAATLAASQDQYLFQPVSIENHPADSRVNIDDSGKVQTLTSRMGTGGGNVPMVLEAICIEGNGTRESHQGNGYSETDKMYTLNTIERHAVAYAAEAQPIVLDRAFYNQGANAQYDPQFYTDGTVPTIVAKGPSAVCVRYIVRRLTPTECARLQGFPDKWGHPDIKTELTDEEYSFWLDVRNTHAEINGKAVKEYTREQMLSWYNKLHTDSAEYKMWGNGIALPCAEYVMEGIADELRKENT